MPGVFEKAHIVCLPSYREGLPKALIEAAAAGLPIVTTDVPGCREVVTDGVHGLCVPARDAGALAVALAKLVADPVLRARMGAAARVRAEAEFGLDAVIAQTLALYREAAA
jgi:glycosyltransferase involved in cell wall biosynthesis